MLPLSGTTKLMKKPDEYSTNPNTVRARKRKAGLNDYQREVEQAKASDTKAITRAWKLRTETDTYKMANDEERKLILENVETEVMDRRRGKGYDADSKIGRFLQRQGTLPPGTLPATPSVSASSSMNNIMDPNLGHLPQTQTPGPQGYSMQPMAPMHMTPHSAQQHASGNSPRSNLPPHMAYYAAYSHGSDDGNNDATTINRLQIDLASEAMTKANLQVQLKAAEETVYALQKKVEILSNDLVITKRSICAQENHVKGLESRMKAYDGTASGLNSTETEFVNQTAKLRRVITGVQKIAEVIGEIGTALVDDEEGGANVANDVFKGAGKGFHETNILNAVAKHQQDTVMGKLPDDAVVGKDIDVDGISGSGSEANINSE